MAPTTRNQKRQRQSSTTEPAIVSSSPNGSAAKEQKKPNGYIKFSSDDDEDAVGGSASGGGVLLDGYLDVTESSAVKDELEGSEDDEEDSDDDAPEAVTIGSGKEAARKREEDAKKAIEAQEEAARQKRKRRDAVLKEQKESAVKRRKVLTGAPAPEPEADEKDTLPFNEETLASEQQVATIPKAKTPALLPESLLEKIVDRPSPPQRTHKKAKDFGSGGEDSDDGILGFDGFGDDEAALAKREWREKTQLARKAKMEFKKGPVNVKVLKDDKKVLKIMMPPANKKVANTKSAWLNGRGSVKRRSIGGGIGGAFSKK